MDMKMYDLIKAAMKEGKSIDDLVDEVNTMAKTVEKEIKPQTPLQEKYSEKFPGAGSMYLDLNFDGTINKEGLERALAYYYTQKGFNPDVCFDTEKEFLDRLGKMLDNDMSVLKVGEKLFSLKLSGASEHEVSSKAVNELTDFVCKTLFGSED